MSSDVLSVVVTAGQTTVLGRGRIFNVLQASSPISVVADRRSNAGGQTLNRVFNSIPAGSKFTAKDGEEWTYLRITSALTQTITIFVGDDDMQFNNAVTVTGTAVVSVSPSNTLNCSADKTLAANSTDAASIPANAARRRVTIGLLSSSAATKIRVSDTGATTRGFEIQAGTFTEFDTTAALGIRNDTAAIATYYIVEEV